MIRESNEPVEATATASASSDDALADKAKTPGSLDTLRVGEKGFTVVLLAVAAFMLYQSVMLWQKKPGVAGPAIIPLLSSGLVVLLSLATVVSNIKKKTAIRKDMPFVGKVKCVCSYLFSSNVLVGLAAIVLYCALLMMGVSFYIVTPIFLWGLMSFYKKGDYLKNLLWTAICMGFIFVVFRLMFNVMIQ